MNEPTHKGENAIFKQNYSLKLFIAFKWPIIGVSINREV